MKSKKLLVIIAIVLVLLVGGICTALYFVGQGDRYSEQRVPLTDDVALYVDVDKLVTKSAIRNVLTSSNLSIVANVVAAETDGAESVEYILGLLENFDNTGLNSKQPIYGYLNMASNVEEDEQTLTIIAEVCDAVKVDRFIRFVLANYGEDVEVMREGDLRVTICEELVIGYNDRRLAIVTTSEGDAVALLNDAMNRPWADLSEFAKYDVACNVRLKPIVTLMHDAMQVQYNADMEYLEACTTKWEREWMAEQLASSQKSLSMLSRLNQQLVDDADMLVGVTFESGRAIAEMVVNGHNPEFRLDKKVDNDHLKCVNEDALAVVNMGVNGEALSALLTRVIDADYADMIGINRNDFNIYVSILCDAVKSIDGDVTLAINDIYGSYYGISGVEALVAIDVKDDYIISNIARYGNGILMRNGTNSFSLFFGGYSFALGQQDDVFYATVNMDYKECPAPASTSRWSKDVEDSYGYVLVNLDSTMANSLIANIWRHSLSSMDSVEANYIDTLVKACSFAYITANMPNSAQVVVVFDDEQSNALEQIVTPLASVAVREMMRNIF